MSLICVQKQLPESSENSKTTLEKGGRNPPDFKLDFVLENLLKYFNELEILCETKKEIEKKYDIDKEHDDCWPEDDIKRAWGKTQRIDEDFRRNRWALVIVLQVLKRQRTKEEESDLNEGRNLVQRCAELSLSDTPYQMKAKRENGRGEDVLWSTADINQACGKAEIMKVISKERSTQSSDELKTLGADGGVKQHSGGNHPTSSYLWQTGSVSQVGPGTQFPFQVWSQATGNSAPDVQSRTLESEENMYSEDETIYIRIPLLETFHNEPTAHLVPYVTSRYKLINGFPSDNIVNITRSYAMSFDNNIGNAEWVYEILNRNTLVNNCDPISFGQGYDKGHLAAAANHRWCREAYNDTYLFRNIIPQNHLLNIRTWRDLEIRCRNMTTDNEIRNVHVYTGPLYIRPMHHFELEGRRKRVPTHLFKVIIVENVNGTVRAPACYVMPNEAPQTTDLNVYRMNIGEFQRVSGLTFIEHGLNLGDTDRIITVTLQGEDLNQTQHNVNIGVRITHNVNR